MRVLEVAEIEQINGAGGVGGNIVANVITQVVMYVVGVVCTQANMVNGAAIDQNYAYGNAIKN